MRGLGEEKYVKFYATMDSVNEALKVIGYDCAVEGCVSGDSDFLIVKVSDGGGSGKGGVLTDEIAIQINVV